MPDRTLRINGRYQNIHHLCAFLMAAGRMAGLDETAVSQLELACDEACTNIIEHAYGGEGKGEISAHWAVDGDWFVVELGDNGRSFDPRTIPPPSTLTESSLDNVAIGGLGIHFMYALTDDIQYTFGEGGNTLTMRKRIA